MSSLTCYGKTNCDKSSNDCKCGAVNKCFGACNNAYWNCPPMMEDGRLWASWQPEAVINSRIQNEQGIKTNWEYREFMQKNGLRIMNFNTLENCYLAGLEYNKDTRKNMNYSQHTPFMFKSVYDTSRPAVGYCNSNLKTPYLSSEQLNARLIAPYIIPSKPQT